MLLSAQFGGPNGIEAQSLGLSSFSALTLLGAFWPVKPVPDMTYDVFGGTLNLAQFNSILTQANTIQPFSVVKVG